MATSQDRFLKVLSLGLLIPHTIAYTLLAAVARKPDAQGHVFFGPSAVVAIEMGKVMVSFLGVCNHISSSQLEQEQKGASASEASSSRQTINSDPKGEYTVVATTQHQRNGSITTKSPRMPTFVISDGELDDKEGKPSIMMQRRMTDASATDMMRDESMMANDHDASAAAGAEHARLLKTGSDAEAGHQGNAKVSDLDNESTSRTDLQDEFPPEPRSLLTVIRGVKKEVLTSNGLRLVPPALLYVCQNNLQIFSAGRLTPAEYQVVGQTKLAFTAIFSVLLLGRKLTRQHWASIAILALGTVIVQTISVQQVRSGNAVAAAAASASSTASAAAAAAAGGISNSDLSQPAPAELAAAVAAVASAHVDGPLPTGVPAAPAVVPPVVEAAAAMAVDTGRHLVKRALHWLHERAATAEPAPVRTQWELLSGTIAMLGASACSGLGGVLVEALLKKKMHFWTTNVHLAFFSLLPALVPVFADAFIHQGMSPFRYFNYIVWSLISLNILGGIIASLTMKYADNILKNFAVAVSLVGTVFLSALVSGVAVTPSQLFGTAMVVAAIAGYARA